MSLAGALNDTNQKQCHEDAAEPDLTGPCFVNRLGRAERFVCELNSVPNLPDRISAIRFKAQFEDRCVLQPSPVVLPALQRQDPTC